MTEWQPAFTQPAIFGKPNPARNHRGSATSHGSGSLCLRRMQYTHVSVSDESNWQSGRYRSIGMLSASRADASALHDETAKILRESGADDFGWKKIRSAKYGFAAQKLIDACARAISDSRLCIDVLIWDSQGRRNTIRNLDREANLQIMYFHLFRNVMSRRWPPDCVWRHIPDERVGVKWENVQSCLSAGDLLQGREPALGGLSPSAQSFGASIKRTFRVAEITARGSQEMSLAPVADMVAGMGAFSREQFVEYRAWKRIVGYPETLFDPLPSLEPGPGKVEKFRVLSHFESTMNQLSLPVALDQTGGLRTLDPSIAVNFWLYQPQPEKAAGRTDREFSW